MTVRIWGNPRIISNLNCLFSVHHWKWVNLSKMAGFNIILSLNERQSSSDKKHNKSSRLVLFFPFRCCFAGSLPFSLSTVKQTKLFHSTSEMFFTFLARKTLWVKLLSLNVGVGWAGRLLTFSAFRMGAYSRWALIRGWALIRINTVICYWKEKNASIEGGSWGNARKRFKLHKPEINSSRKNILLESKRNIWPHKQFLPINAVSFRHRWRRAKYQQRYKAKLQLRHFEAI